MFVPEVRLVVKKRGEYPVIVERLVWGMRRCHIRQDKRRRNVGER